MIRLDKYICAAAFHTRSEAVKMVKRGFVTVNGEVVKDNSLKINEQSDKVTLAGKPLIYNRYIYIMLNKPDGYVSATEDGCDKTVIDLLTPELQKKELFPVGRLDKNTLGLILLTNNGNLAHKMLSPKSHVEKKYYFEAKFPISNNDLTLLENGIVLDTGYKTKRAKIELIKNDKERKKGYIYLSEGKYHQIKKMFIVIHNQIIHLERVGFGPLLLDSALERGKWRYLTENEMNKVEKYLI